MRNRMSGISSAIKTRNTQQGLAPTGPQKQDFGRLQEETRPFTPSVS